MLHGIARNDSERETPMVVVKEQVVPLRSGEDVVRIRQLVRERSIALRFSLVQQTKMVTAASELARNTLHHGRGGEMKIEQLTDGGRASTPVSATTRRAAGPSLGSGAVAEGDWVTLAAGADFVLRQALALLQRRHGSRRRCSSRCARLHDGQHLVAGHCGACGHANLAQHTGYRRGHFEHHLVGFKVREVFIPRHGVADFLAPAHQRGVGNGLGKLGNFDLDCHVRTIL